MCGVVYTSRGTELYCTVLYCTVLYGVVCTSRGTELYCTVLYLSWHLLQGSVFTEDELLIRLIRAPLLAGLLHLLQRSGRINSRDTQTHSATHGALQQ